MPTLYGGGCRAINRRALLAGAVALAATRPAHAALPKRRLTWTGRAHASVNGRELDLAVDTMLDLPSLRVRSASRPAGPERALARVLTLGPGTATVRTGCVVSQLPEATAAHERQQFALYALLYLVQQRRGLRPGRLAVSEPLLPDAVFDIGADGFPLAAELTIAAPVADAPPIAERIIFSGRLESNGVRWPRRFSITQDRAPYFTLDVDRFEATA